MNARHHDTSSDSLTRYLDEAGTFATLDASGEREQARELVELRLACWTAALHSRASLRRLVESSNDATKTFEEGLWTDTARTQELAAALSAADPDRVALDAMLEMPRLSKTRSTAIRTARHRYQRARNTFMCRNLRLVVTVAKRFGRAHMSLADRVQEGNLGLIKAIDRFDPERGFRFSTYAAWWIRHTVTRALMRHGRTVRVPAHVHTLFTKLRHARPELRGKLGRPATTEELAEFVGVPHDKVLWALESMELRSVGLDTPVGGGDARSLAELIPDEHAEGWTERLEGRLDGRLARHVTDHLDPKARDIVATRYGLDGRETSTLRELGERYGVSRERIRQLQVRAVEQLRGLVESSTLSSVALSGTGCNALDAH